MWQNAILVQGQEPSADFMLASVPHREQKLGEQLFPLTQATHSLVVNHRVLPDVDDSELLHRLEFPESLHCEAELQGHLSETLLRKPSSA